MDTGKIISDLRNGAGLTQEELAERLYVSRALVQKWETGKRRPDRGYLEAIAELCGADTGVFDGPDGDILAELASCVPENCGLTDERVIPLLEGFLQTLPSRERNIFIKRYHFLRSAKEISAETGIRQGHVRTILSRTRSKLKEFFKENTL
ncbi:MAG: helix-turn-helix domain-containing protein [Clostridia bacterium]|nr:helix-turn-helix domain-containing protein [Clostridia bacterium]